MFNETPDRSVGKAVSWRVLATLTTGLLVYAFTQRLDIAFTVGAIEVVAKLLLYFLHERVWDRLGFGCLAVGQVQASERAGYSSELEHRSAGRGSITA